MRCILPNFTASRTMALSLFLLTALGHGQTAGDLHSPSAPLDGSELHRQLNAISTALAAAQTQLEQSRRQIQQLENQLREVQDALNGSTAASSSVPLAEEAPTSDIDLKERIETLEAEVKLHDQTKVESNSNYPVRVSGLFLFNGFLNRGAVDNFDLPSIAIGQNAGVGTGGSGASLRQTILAIEATGPHLGGAKTSARLSVDFFGGIPYTSYGTVAGILRLRTASISLDWPRDLVQLGIETPLISPLSPTSYATVGQPGMAWAGNLWTWAPQARIAHQFLKSEDQSLKLEFGLWDPPASGYNSTTNTFRTPSAGELSSQPAYESRISYASSSDTRALQIGLGGYYSRQRFPSTQSSESPAFWSNDSWAVTTDFRVPLSGHFELSGEGYRGRSLGGLGGGLYKDVLYGTGLVTGYPVIRGVNDIGGWTQLKSRLGQLVEVNTSIGLDNSFAGDFQALSIPANAPSTQFLARNRMVVTNLIYHPKTYLVFSPEYRRIWTWSVSGPRNAADVYTLSLGYQF